MGVGKRRRVGGDDMIFLPILRFWLEKHDSLKIRSNPPSAAGGEEGGGG